MSWLGWRERHGQPVTAAAGDLRLRGALLVEFTAPGGRGRVNILRAAPRDPEPAQITIVVGPCGLELLQGRGEESRSWHLPLPDLTEGEPVIASLQWDIPARQGMLTAWLPARPALRVVAAVPPLGLSAAEAAALLDPAAVVHPAGAVACVALSDRPVAIGPVGGIGLDAPVAAPGGALAAGDLRAGDAVLLAGGGLARILWAGRVSLPPVGWYRPHRIRAPYLGARADLLCSGDLGIRLAGGQVEYLFGRETVSAAARQLVDARSVLREAAAVPQVWVRLILDRPGEIAVAGLTLDAPDIIGLRHDPRLLAAAGFAALADIATPRATAPRLRDHEALVLCRARSAA